MVACINIHTLTQSISSNFSENSLSKCTLQPKIAKKITKTPIFGVQGRSRSSMLVPTESSSAVLVKIRSKSVSICNRSRATLVDSSRKHAFWRGYPNLMHSYGGLLVPSPRGSKLALLTSTLNTENFIRRSSWSISSDLHAVHSWNVCGSLKLRKNSLKIPILGFKVVQGNRCWYPLKARQQCLLW